MTDFRQFSDTFMKFKGPTFNKSTAICAAMESPQRISLSTDHIAIGMVGSSDIASNLLVGGFSESLLAEVGWEGYFPCVAAASAVTVIAATALFPNYQDDVSFPRSNDLYRVRLQGLYVVGSFLPNLSENGSKA